LLLINASVVTDQANIYSAQSLLYPASMPPPASILLIEDSPGECELFRLALAQAKIDAVLSIQHEAETALEFLANRYRQSSIQTGSSPLQDGGLTPLARSISQAQASAGQQTPSPGEGLPSVILLDWHLQKTRGERFLVQLRSDPRLASIPVVVFTTSDDSSDMAAGYARGANGYVVKPATFDELVQFVGDLCSYWLTWNRTLSSMTTAC
jgi:CheY-like chemotaxis protein